MTCFSPTKAQTAEIEGCQADSSESRAAHALFLANSFQVEITELPVRKWTQDYKQFLESLLVGAEDAKAKDAKGKGKGKAGDKDKDKEKAPSRCIKDFKENHTDTS